jgi:hypothetical protein
MSHPEFRSLAVRHAWVHYAGADLDVYHTLSAGVGRLAWGANLSWAH